MTRSTCRTLRSVWLIQHCKLNFVIRVDVIRVDAKLNFVEEPVEILEREFKKPKRSRIAIVKVQCNSKRSPKFTWEREDQMKLMYPHLFSDASARQAAGARIASGQAGGVSNVSSQSGGSSQPIAKQSTSIGVMNASSQPSAAPSTLSQGPTQHRAGPRQGFQAPRPGFPTLRLARRLPADTAQGNCHLSSVIMQWVFEQYEFYYK
ncbi:hypothetical protein Tco_0471779 [Tanacetum coccineum]